MLGIFQTAPILGQTFYQVDFALMEFIIELLVKTVQWNKS